MGNGKKPRFFEKKRAKNLASMGLSRSLEHRPKGIRNFLILFFQKEPSLP
jgi:hypothetical protein